VRVEQAAALQKRSCNACRERTRACWWLAGSRRNQRARLVVCTVVAGTVVAGTKRQGFGYLHCLYLVIADDKHTLKLGALVGSGTAHGFAALVAGVPGCS
jgi:hypothetical protein